MTSDIRRPFVPQTNIIRIVFLACLLSVVACKKSNPNILVFNEKIVTEQEAIINAENQLIESLNNRKTGLIEKDYQDLLSQIIISENKVNELTDPDPNIGFKDATLKLITSYKNQTLNGYKTLVELSYLPDSSYTAKEEKKFEEISSSIFITLNSEVNTFILTQKKLAEKYKFPIKK